MSPLGSTGPWRDGATRCHLSQRAAVRVAAVPSASGKDAEAQAAHAAKAAQAAKAAKAALEAQTATAAHTYTYDVCMNTYIYISYANRLHQSVC